MQGWYDRVVVSAVTHRVLSTPAVDAVRASLLQDLTGRVLEIGFGSGLSLPFYGARVTDVLAVDPDDAGWQRSAPARELSASNGRVATRAGSDASHISLPDDSVDVVVSMWTLCTVPDMATALSELTRVLRPGGVVVAAEHGPSSRPSRRRIERIIEPVWRPLAGGCHLTREPWLALTDLRTRDSMPDNPNASPAYSDVAISRPSDSAGLPPGTRLIRATKAE